MQLRTREAKSKFDYLIEEVEKGHKTVTLWDDKKPVAQIVPAEEKPDVVCERQEAGYRYQTMGETLAKLKS